MTPWAGRAGFADAPTIAMVRAEVRSSRSSTSVGLTCAMMSPSIGCAANVDHGGAGS